MAYYGIALGGNKRNWAFWDNFYASANTAGNIDYAAHLKTRHKGLPFKFDGCNEDWQNYFSQEMPTGEPVVGDVFATHWINAGTDVSKLIVHIKRAAPAGTVITVGVRDATGATIGTDVDVPLDTPGYIKVPVDELLQTNGTVQMIYTAAGTSVGVPAASPGGLDMACFAIFADLFNGHDEAPCVCCVPKCDVPTPTPECFTPTRGC